MVFWLFFVKMIALKVDQFGVFGQKGAREKLSKSSVFPLKLFQSWSVSGSILNLINTSGDEFSSCLNIIASSKKVQNHDKEKTFVFLQLLKMDTLSHLIFNFWSKKNDFVSKRITVFKRFAMFSKNPICCFAVANITLDTKISQLLQKS